MNKANLKSYAPKARVDFIKAVTERANVLGISAAGAAPARLRGDVAIIDGREWPAKVAGQRDELIARIKRHGFDQTMDEVAYTWFNRFAALRYMEIHDYLGHGWRVLSSRDGGLPEILRHASEVTLPGLNADRAREMQLAGNQDNELYKLLLVAQCNELSRVMPFLFERIDDETELLLPENLLRTDSIVAKLVEWVPEEDWQEIEVIGWLYQFYISEEKERVDKKVKSGGSVEPREIPAKTQLFTPNWVVQYLVQNSVGRLWLMANPNSTLASQWPYYTQPAEQMPEVQAELDALIQTRILEDGDSLNPETVTVLDPACGSGHILVVAYDVLKAIYLERGYQPRSIPRLILEKNLYGLDIDHRAAQLAALALLMKARADDRRLFTDPPKLNVLGLRESRGLRIEELITQLAPFGLQHAAIKALVDVFDDAKNLGSLINIPPLLNGSLVEIAERLRQALRGGDLFAAQAAKDVLPLVGQARLLSMHFDVVVANPPYMGGKGMNTSLKVFAKSQFPISKSDLFAMFIERGFDWLKRSGLNSMVTMQSWMFLSSYEKLRIDLLNNRTAQSMVHMGNGVMGIAFGTAATTFLAGRIDGYVGSYSFCANDDLNEAGCPAVFPVRNSRLREVSSTEFNEIPGSPFAYWASRRVRKLFGSSKLLGDVVDCRQGMASSDDARFVRYHWEVLRGKVCLNAADRSAALASGAKWFPYDKGGDFRKWFGNNLHVIDWCNDGEAVLQYAAKLYGSPTRTIKNIPYFFRSGITWSAISSGRLSVRSTGRGHIFSNGGMKAFCVEEGDLLFALGLLNSKVTEYLISFLSETVNFDAGLIAKVPFIRNASIEGLSRDLISMHEESWDSQETSWNFKGLPFVSPLSPGLASAWEEYERNCLNLLKRVQSLEECNNRQLLAAYGLQDELSPDVPEDQITLARAERERDCQRLVSYAIGCMMGRYSLAEAKLVPASEGNVGSDGGHYRTAFPSDVDGILPITGERWFEEDAATRVRDFLRVVWGVENVDENMAWLATSLGPKVSDAHDETIRRYLADKFYKDHLQTYKKRPIYWLFSSGKQGAFQALVYLHRYNAGTLARMRAEYVVPLITKVVSRLDMLDKDVAAATTAAARTKLQKQIESLHKKQIELLAYDEKLRHYADMRITLDLDDGVKVNYAKFGDLVAEAKTISGGKDED